MYYNLFLPFLCKIYRNSVTSCAPKVMSHSSKAVSFSFLFLFLIFLVFLIILLRALSPLLGLRLSGGGGQKRCFYRKDVLLFTNILNQFSLNWGVSKEICPSANNTDNNIYNKADVECFKL